VSQVARLIAIVIFLFMFRDQPVEVDIRGEGGHVFAEIVVSVDLKDLHLHLLNVFDVDEKSHCLIDTEGLLVVVGKLDVGRVLKLVDN
jgi:hypothetical protein